MTANGQEDTLDVLACDFRARPRGAPTIFDVLPAVRAVKRFPSHLEVEFDSARSDIVAGYVGAERMCCRDIRWELEREAVLKLVVTARPAQLDVLEQLYRDQ